MWCAEGVELLASHQIEKCTCYEFASRALKNITEFLQKSCDLQLSEELEHHSILDGTISPETRALVQQVSKYFLFKKSIVEVKCMLQSFFIIIHNV